MGTVLAGTPERYDIFCRSPFRGDALPECAEKASRLKPAGVGFS
jgi:hypothetical protein